jgi:hypothetical protein
MQHTEVMSERQKLRNVSEPVAPSWREKFIDFLCLQLSERTLHSNMKNIKDSKTGSTTQYEESPQ